MKNIKVFLATKETLAFELNPAATVEAEYGDIVVEGSKTTLAHHAGKYAGEPAPCSVDNVPLLEEHDIIVVSHIDADTIGGCLALIGCKPECKEFWDAIAYVDVKGPHHAHELNPTQYDMLNAYWAWNATLPRVRYTEVTDVTDVVLAAIPIINSIIQKDDTMITNGRNWHDNTEQAIAACLVKETPRVRCFRTDGVFCSASYYSHLLKQVIPATVSLNSKTRAITIAFEDGGKHASAVQTVQALWGAGAGGHAGIAGSPRGWDISDEALEAEFERACTAVGSL